MSNITLKKLKSKSSEKISKYEDFTTPHNDLYKYSYTRTWTQNLSVNVYGYDVALPDMPPKEDIINYGKPISEQIFRKTALPEGFSYWSEQDQESFIQKEHHRRREGLWFYIKGKPTYITGLHYYFLNYWNVESGLPTKFHMGDWKFWILWMYVVLNPSVFGLVVFKCRRVGDTEKGLCMIYEYATRVRNTLNQLYDCRVEKDMIKTWKRLRTAHQRMVWFMKPVTKNDDAATTLEFRTQKRKLEKSNSFIDEKGQLHAGEYLYKELDSEISYYTNSGGADGSRVGRGYVDEFGKFDQINPEELWSLMKKALEDGREGKLIGKCLFTSTIEEMKGGSTLTVSREMWDQADPNNLDEKGRTISGLIRCVRGALDRGEGFMDRWGYIDEKAVLEDIQSQIDFLIKNKKWEKLIALRRQSCISFEDVFCNISKGSPFNLMNITNRKNELEYGDIKTWVRGDLEWKDGIKPLAGDPNKTNRKCKVYFIPNEDSGKWYFAHHPKDFGLRENDKELNSYVPKPGNTSFFSAGIDPVAYRNNLDDKANKSLSGLAVKRNFDPSVDNDPDLYNENNEPIDFGRNFKTNRYCCAYLYRHDKPSDNYDDWLKTLVYYGSDFLIEKNHSAGFNTYLEMLGFSEYYYDSGSGMSNYKGKQESLGVTATDKSIEKYFGDLVELVATWVNTIDIPIILDQLSTMEYETRGQHDLGVAVGMCEWLANVKTQAIAAEREYQQQDDFEFMEENVFSGD